MLSFKSTELLTVFSLEEQYKLRTILEQNGISYTVSVKHQNDCYGFFPVVGVEEMLTQPMQYVFYVHEKDKQQAVSVLQKGGVSL